MVNTVEGQIPFFAVCLSVSFFCLFFGLFSFVWVFDKIFGIF